MDQRRIIPDPFRIIARCHTERPICPGIYPKINFFFPLRLGKNRIEVFLIIRLKNRPIRKTVKWAPVSIEKASLSTEIQIKHHISCPVLRHLSCYVKPAAIPNLSPIFSLVNGMIGKFQPLIKRDRLFRNRDNHIKWFGSRHDVVDNTWHGTSHPALIDLFIKVRHSLPLSDTFLSPNSN